MTAATWKDAFRNQSNVIRALVLHDIKSRFFGNGIGQIAMIIWPGVHMLIVIGMFYVSGRTGYGSSNILYAATGVLPFIYWNYISRFAMLSVIQNRNYMQYPIIKLLDIVFARIFLEIVTVTLVTIVLFIVLFFLQINGVPNDPGQAFLGLMSALLLGVGFGVLASVIARLLPLFNIIYILFIVSFWLTCGMSINPEGLPDPYGYYLSFNPLFHSVEWVRLAYYVDYPHRLLSKSYVVSVGLISLTLGLLLEKALRRFGS